MKPLILILFILIFFTCNPEKEKVAPSISQTNSEKEKIILLAKNKIQESKLDEILLKSKLTLICVYEEHDVVAYDMIGILNFQVILIKIATLKGVAKNEKIFIHVHSPGLSGFGYEKNYGKKFLIFLDDDKFEDGHYAEGIDFIKAIILEE